MGRGSVAADPSLSGRDDIRVVHVDDEPGFAEMVGEFIERECNRLSVTTASSADEVLARLDPDEVDCVISDYEMPEATGLELFAELRDRGIDIPFVLYTGKGSESIASEAVSAGVTDYVRKQTGTDQYALLAKRVEEAVAKHRAERELERHGDLLDRTQEIGSIGGWELEVESGRLRWTRETYRIYGVPDSFDPTLEDAIERYHPEDVPVIRSAVERAVEDGEPFDLELRLLTPEDDVKWVRARGEPIGRTDEGVAGRLRGTVQDISDHVANEAELRLKNRALDEADVGVTISDPTRDDRPIVYANEGFERMTGYSTDEVLGRNHQILQGPETDDAAVAAMCEAVEDERPETVDVLSYRKDGTEFWNRVSLSPIFEDGSLTHVLRFQRDVTDQKRVERELRSSEVALEELYRVASDSDLTFDQRLRQTLRTGCERLGLSFGFLTHISDGTQTIVEARGSHERLRTGESVRLERSYCRETLETDGLFGIENAHRDGWTDDPAYDAFALDCYLGGTVTVDGEQYGTLCFADSTVRDDPFTDSERAFVELLTNWVSHELEQRRTGRQLERKAERLDRFTSVASEDIRDHLNDARSGLDRLQSVDDERLEAVETPLSRIETLVDALARRHEDAFEATEVDLGTVAKAAWDTVETGEAVLDVTASGSVETQPDCLRQLFGSLFGAVAERGGPDDAVTVSDRESGFAVETGVAVDGTAPELDIAEGICEVYGWTMTTTVSQTGGTRFEVSGVERP